MNEMFLVGMIMGIPPWGMILGRFGIFTQVFGLILLVANYIK